MKLWEFVLNAARSHGDEEARGMQERFQEAINCLRSLLFAAAITRQIHKRVYHVQTDYGFEIGYISCNEVTSEHQSRCTDDGVRHFHLR